jgi:hypothetical protein
MTVQLLVGDCLEEKGQMRLWDEECTGLCGV